MPNKPKKVSGLVETGLTGLVATVVTGFLIDWYQESCWYMINSTYRVWWWSYRSNGWPSMLYKRTRKRIADLFVRRTKVGYINASKEILHHIGSFRAARLPRQATRTAEPLQVSVSNNHDWPEFYPGNARVLPGFALVWNCHCFTKVMYPKTSTEIRVCPRNQSFSPHLLYSSFGYQKSVIVP